MALLAVKKYTSAIEQDPTSSSHPRIQNEVQGLRNHSIQEFARSSDYYPFFIIMETCYKMWRSEIIKSVNLKGQRFGFEPEVTAKVSRIPKVCIYEVGISYFGRTYEEGKKINWKDGVRAIYCILKYNIWSKK